MAGSYSRSTAQNLLESSEEQGPDVPLESRKDLRVKREEAGGSEISCSES